MGKTNEIKEPKGTPKTVMRSYRLPLETITDLGALAKLTGDSQTQILIKGVELQKNASL